MAVDPVDLAMALRMPFPMAHPRQNVAVPVGLIPICRAVSLARRLWVGVAESDMQIVDVHGRPHAGAHERIQRRTVGRTVTTAAPAADGADGADGVAAAAPAAAEAAPAGSAETTTAAAAVAGGASRAAGVVAASATAASAASAPATSAFALPAMTTTAAATAGADVEVVQFPGRQRDALLVDGAPPDPRSRTAAGGGDAALSMHRAGEACGAADAAF